MHQLWKQTGGKVKVVRQKDGINAPYNAKSKMRKGRFRRNSPFLLA